MLDTLYLCHFGHALWVLYRLLGLLCPTVAAGTAFAISLPTVAAGTAFALSLPTVAAGTALHYLSAHGGYFMPPWLLAHCGSSPLLGLSAY